MIGEFKIINHLARRYALAYFNVFGKYIDHTQRDLLYKAFTFLKTKKDLFHLLQFSFKNHQQIKKEFWKKFIIDKHLPEHLIQLSSLLVEHGRIELLPSILQKIVTLYDIHAPYITFQVATACPLTNDLEKEIGKMLAHTTKKAVHCNYHIDPSLIAGIRAQSYDLLWEHSIRKQIKTISHALNT